MIIHTYQNQQAGMYLDNMIQIKSDSILYFIWKHVSASRDLKKPPSSLYLAMS